MSTRSDARQERARARKVTDHHPGAEHHRDITGGAARAAVFGVSDGLVSNVSIVLGVAGGAHYAATYVRLAGLVGLIGGAVSMALGEYISMTAQAELLEHELEVERTELRRRPESEKRELVEIYESKGVDRRVAEELATEVMRDPDLALETHAREELGVDPSSLGSPKAAALSSFASFAIGALVPVLPWFFGGGRAAVVVSMLLAAVAALAVGAALARFTERPALRSALRQLAFSAAAAGVSYGIGSAVGVKAG